MKKKIVFIITDYGSFNNFLAEIAIELVRMNIEIHLISSSTKVIKIEDKYDYIREGIKIHNVELPRGFNLLKHLKASKEIHKIVDQIKPNLISIHFTTGIFTSTFKKRFKYKTIGTIHGLGYPVVDGFVKKIIYKLVERRSINRVDQLWVLNKTDFDIITVDFSKVDLHLIPTKGLGCDLKKFDPNVYNDSFKIDFKKSLLIEKDDFVIAFTGRFVTFKGYEKIVKAFKLLIENGENSLKLVLIGGKDDAHPTGLNNIEQKWVNENQSIINIGFTNNVQEYLSITDLFVFPSEKEGMPVCIIEALAMNIPVITANARGCNDLIVDNHNGILLKDNTPEEIANQILYLKNNKDIYDLMKNSINEERLLMDRKLFVNQQLNFFNKMLN